MEPEGSLPYSQTPATGPYPERIFRLWMEVKPLDTGGGGGSCEYIE
jgi:hypothetical protein